MPIVAALSAKAQALFAVSVELDFESLAPLFSVFVDSVEVLDESVDFVSEPEDSVLVDVDCAFELRLSLT